MPKVHRFATDEGSISFRQADSDIEIIMAEESPVDDEVIRVLQVIIGPKLARAMAHALLSLLDEEND